MSSTSTSRNTQAKQESIFRAIDIADDVLIWQNTIVMSSAGYATFGATATGAIGLGRARFTYDNTVSGHALGAISVEVEHGEFKWANGDSIVEADVGKLAYIADNQTVTKDGTGKSPLGWITKVDSDGVWVDTPDDLAAVLGYAATGATASAATPQPIGDPAAGAGTSFSRDDHVHAITCVPVGYQSPADAAANTALAEHVIFTAHGKSIKILAAKIESDGALTADNTNNAVITVKQGDGAGGARSTVATLTTNVASGNWVAFTAKDLGAITNPTVPADGIITVTVTKGGAGVQMPAFRLSLSVTTDV